MSKEAGKGNILIVDDQVMNLSVITNMLSQRGYRVRPAINGRLALKSARKYPPDLILLDIVMPGLDGYEVCEQLKADERTRDIPVIFISSLGETHSKIKAFAVGGLDYVTKPFQVEEIVARIETQLTLRAVQKQLREKNLQLEQEITERVLAEKELEKYRDQLEFLVNERTAELKATNEKLVQEINERKQVERALRQSEARYRHLAQENKSLLEQAQQDARTKTTLLNEVNHRVKNNLTAIIGLLLTEQRFAHTGASGIYRVRLNGLISRVQGLARVHSMLSAAEWRPLPLDELVREVSSTALQMTAYHSKVALEVSPSTVRVTAEQASSLALIVNELVTNSVQHVLGPDTDHQHVSINIYIDFGDNGYQANSIPIRFELKDDGPGYPDAVVRNEQESQGLGLYLVRNLVRRDLLGDLSLANDQGAVTVIQFKTRATPRVEMQPAS